MKKYISKNNPQLWFDLFPEYEKQPHFENPKDDNERFINAQSSWIETGEQSYWLEMWEITELLCRKNLTKEMHEKDLKFTKDQREGIIFDAVEYLLIRYSKHRGYVINQIVTQTMLAVRHILFTGKENQMLENELIDVLNSGESKDYAEALTLAQKRVSLKIQKDNN